MEGLSRLLVTLLCVFVLAANGFASEAPQRILLVPVDDRPATTQFPTMIAGMAGIEVATPPVSILGKFTQPGSPESILTWMESKGLKQYDAVVVSLDMIAYGGLIASRTDRSSNNLAVNRLNRFWALAKKAPNTKIYAFGSIMRVAPTATISSRGWRDQMAKYAELRIELAGDDSAETKKRLENLRKQIPAAEIERYDRTRARNLKICEHILRMASMGAFYYLQMGEDDAKPTGPQKAERIRLAEMAKNLNLGTKIGFAAGIDQVASLLVSRSAVVSAQWAPRIRVVYADEAGRKKIASYESLPIEESLKSQIEASGAVFAGPDDNFDYSLYVNTPDPSIFSLDAFIGSLKAELEQGFPVAVADTNLGPGGIADPRIFNALTEQGRSARLLAYAGWNTAGNSMGTTVPAANTYLLARRTRVDQLTREVGLRTFLLHRLVNDFEYHNFVRPQAYAMIDNLPKAPREEAYGPEFEQVAQRVVKELGQRLEDRFDDQMLGTRFFANDKQYEITGIQGVHIDLPWPRAYEVSLQFELVVNPVVTSN